MNENVHSYGRTKLGNNLFAREIAKRHLADTEKPILAISVHPGTVDTDVQGNWSESYGFLGKILEKGSALFGKTAPEGAEASLWAAASTDIYEGNWKDYQVCIVSIKYHCSTEYPPLCRASTSLSHMARLTRRRTSPRATRSRRTSGSCARRSPRRSSERTCLRLAWAIRSNDDMHPSPHGDPGRNMISDCISTSGDVPSYL